MPCNCLLPSTLPIITLACSWWHCALAHCRIAHSQCNGALQVHVCLEDVSSAEGARAAVAEASALAPVAGIMHLAMVLDDVPLASQACTHMTVLYDGPLRQTAAMRI